RRYTFSMPSYSPNGSLIGSRTFKPSKPSIALSEKGIALGNGFLGGPRQVSLQLTASNALLQRTALRLAQSRGAFDGLADLRGIVAQAQKQHKAAAVVEETAAPVMEPVAEPRFEANDQDQTIAQRPAPAEKPSEIPAVVEEAVTPVIEPVGEPQFEAI